MYLYAEECKWRRGIRRRTCRSADIGDNFQSGWQPTLRWWRQYQLNNISHTFPQSNQRSHGSLRHADRAKSRQIIVRQCVGRMTEEYVGEIHIFCPEELEL